MTLRLDAEPLSYADWLAVGMGMKPRREPPDAPEWQNRHMGPGPHKTGSPQAIHGAAGGRVPYLIAKQGGETVQPLVGARPTSGFMVARPPDQGMIIQADDWFSRGDEMLLDFVDRKYEVYEGHHEAFLGIWWDRTHAEVAVDVSINVLDIDEAIRLGREWNQQSIWDVVHQREIPTGGTGGRSGHLADPAAGRLADVDARAEVGVDPGAGRRDEAGDGLRVWRVGAEVIERLRHLPGKHDQKTHGHGLSGPKNPMLGPESVAAGRLPLSPAARAKVEALKKKWGWDEEGMQADADAAFGAPECVESGRRWYAEEMGGQIDALAGRTGVGIEESAAAIAISSARNRWVAEDGRHLNTETAEDLIRVAQEHPDMTAAEIARQYPVGYMMQKGFGLNVISMIRGESTVDEAVTGAKRRSFMNNGMDPEGSWDITNDAIMAQFVAKHCNLSADQIGGMLSGDAPKYLEAEGLSMSPMYVAVTEMVLAAHARHAAAAGFTRPHQTQATLWVAEKKGVI